MSTVSGLIVSRFLERHHGILAANSIGLVDCLKRSVSEQATMISIWGPSVGAMDRVEKLNSEDPVAVAAAFALCCAGVPGGCDWRASLLKTGRLRWRQWFFPQATELALTQDSCIATVAVTSANGVISNLKLDPTVGSITGCESFPLAGTQRSIVLLPGSVTSTDLRTDFDELKRVSTPRVESLMVRAMESAIDLLNQYAPQYRRWVERVVFEVFISQLSSGSRSGSWDDAPGTVQISSSPDPMIVAEALVHEASHQYAYQVFRVDRLDDGSDTTLYYSPAARRERPLERIVFAYHAFANVLLFYLEAVAAGIPIEPWVSKRIERSRDLVDELEKPVRNNRALTPAGRAIYETLAEHLRAAAL